MSGSLTTETHNFPMFRIYEIDSITNYPVNHYTYYLNISKQN